MSLSRSFCRYRSWSGFLVALEAIVDLSRCHFSHEASDGYLGRFLHIALQLDTS